MKGTKSESDYVCTFLPNLKGFVGLEDDDFLRGFFCFSSLIPLLIFSFYKQTNYFIIYILFNVFFLPFFCLLQRCGNRNKLIFLKEKSYYLSSRFPLVPF